MPGGTLKIHVEEDWSIQMEGEVKEIAAGQLSNELIAEL
jgi:diaminopimelate epimerase